MTMEFLNKNLITTETSFTDYAGNTGTGFGYLIDNDADTQFTSADYDLTISADRTFEIVLSSTVTVNRVIIKNHNFIDSVDVVSIVNISSVTGGFLHTTIQLDDPGAGSSVGTFSTTGDSIYFRFATNSSSNRFGIRMIKSSTTSKTVNFKMGEVVLTTFNASFDRNPNAANYNPIIFRKQVRHEMADGGVSLYNIEDKFRANISFKYITQDFKNDLFNLYKQKETFYFVPNPGMPMFLDGLSVTSTSWDGEAYPVSWVGNFNFKQTENHIEAGFSGSIVLEGIS